MKNINYKINGSKLVVLFLVLVMACKKEEVGQFSLSRQFSPSKFTFTNGETQSVVTWSASLFTTSDQQVSYTVEVDSTTDFLNPAFTATTTDLSVIVTNKMIPIKKDYYARVKALSQGNTGESNWTVSQSFKILGEQFLNPVTSDKVIDKSVRLTWRANSELTKLIIKPTAGGAKIQIDLTAADLAAMLKQVDNLTPGVTYNAEIFAGTLSKGDQTFTTVAPLTGNVVDLRGISVASKPNILLDTLPDIPSGSIVLLKRGSAYVVSTGYSLGKSVTIQSGLDFGTNLATIKMMTFFNLVANSSIDSLVFKDLIIKGGKANFGSLTADYLLNASVAATVGTVRLDNCIIKILRGVVRGQGTPGPKYTNYFVNNCVIDSVHEYGVATANNAASFTNIKITKTTVYRAWKFITHAVTGNTSIKIQDCTFNEVVTGASTVANFFIDLNGFANTGGVSISNTIIGAYWAETKPPYTGTPGTLLGGIRAPAAQAVNIDNSYSTSDFFANPANTNPIVGLKSYNGTSTALFVDPNNGSNPSFKFKDANFIGKQLTGDPRWR